MFRGSASTTAFSSRTCAEFWLWLPLRPPRTSEPNHHTGRPPSSELDVVACSHRRLGSSTYPEKEMHPLPYVASRRLNWFFQEHEAEAFTSWAGSEAKHIEPVAERSGDRVSIA